MALTKGFEAIMTPANNDMRGTYIFPLNPYVQVRMSA